jgi:hypothetical protein
MIRPSADRLAPLAPALALAITLAGAPLAAQQTFSLPPASPAPTPAPAPAGPADERAGVAIPPRAAPNAAPTTTPTTPPRIESRPVIEPLPAPSASRPRPLASPTPRGTSAAPAPSATLAQPAPSPALPAGEGPGTAPVPAPTSATAPGFSLDPTTPSDPAPRPEGAPVTAGLPAWWPFAAGGLAALALLGVAALLWRQHKRKLRPLRLAALVAGVTAGDDTHAGSPLAAAAPPRLDLTLEIITGTRSLVMFTLEYRLTIANRSERAVGDLNAAVQIACARAGAAPSPGAAQALAAIDRIGPGQARSVTGTVQLPLSAIAPLRQGTTPLFVPLTHVTLEGESLPACVRTFVIGTPSASGRVHPIALDVPPGGIAGLVAQAVTLPPAHAPASAAA